MIGHFLKLGISLTLDNPPALQRGDTLANSRLWLSRLVASALWFCFVIRTVLCSALYDLKLVEINLCVHGVRSYNNL